MKELNLKEKIKEKAEKVENFVEDHFGVIMLGGLTVFAVAMGVSSNRQTKKFLDNATQDNQMYLMASLAKSAKEGD